VGFGKVRGFREQFGKHFASLVSEPPGLQEVHLPVPAAHDTQPGVAVSQETQAPAAVR